jgi:hypothetical protein
MITYNTLFLEHMTPRHETPCLMVKRKGSLPFQTLADLAMRSPKLSDSYRGGV